MPKGISKPKAIEMAAQKTSIVPPNAKYFPGSATPLPEGVAVRSGKGVQIDFMLHGVRRSVTMKGKPTIAHVLAAADKRQRVMQLIGLGHFNFAEEFPDSPQVRDLAADAQPPRNAIGDALNDWLAHTKSTVGPNAFKDYKKDSKYLKAIPLYMFESPDVPRDQRRGGLLEELPAAALTDTGIVHFRAWLLAKPLSIKRINNVLIPLRGAMQRLHNNDAIRRNPFDSVRPLVQEKPALPDDDSGQDLDAPLPLEDVAQFKGEDRLPDPFSPAESDAILNQLSGPFYNQTLFWLWTGLRTGELIALRWSDIDLERKRIFIRRSVSRGIMTFPKFRRERWVDLPQPAMAALRAQFDHTGQQRSWVFINPWTGKRWANESKICSRFKKACELAGVRYRRPYHCRHTYASTLLSAGENPLYVAEQMGHKDWTMISKVYGRWIRQVDHMVGQRLAQMHESNWAALESQVAVHQAPAEDLACEEDGDIATSALNSPCLDDD